MRLDEIDNIVKSTVHRHYFNENIEEERDNIFKDLCGYLPDSGICVGGEGLEVVVEVDDKYTWTFSVEGVSFDRIKEG